MPAAMHQNSKGTLFDTLYNAITMKSPPQINILPARWTRGMIGSLACDLHVVRISRTSFGNSLLSKELAYKLPIVRTLEQSRWLSDARFHENLLIIKMRAVGAKAQVPFVDAVKIRWDRHAGLVWRTSGKPPLIRAPGQRPRLDMRSSISGNDSPSLMDRGKILASHDFNECIDHLTQGRREEEFSLLDARSMPKVTVVKEHGAGLRGRLEMLYLTHHYDRLNSDETPWDQANPHTIGVVAN